MSAANLVLNEPRLQGQPRSSPSYRSRCRWCHAVISSQQARLHENTCDNWRCRLAYQVEWGKRKAELQLKERERQLQRVQAVQKSLADAADRTGTSLPPDTIPVPLPANIAPLAPLSESRRDRFHAHLRNVITEAFASRLESGSTHAMAAPPAHDESASWPQLLATACGVCQGHCCRCGEEHAYISSDTILNYLVSHPEVTPEDVFRAYDDWLADECVDGSCVYHQAHGCGLPREWRSTTCNRFECAALHNLRQSMSAASGPTTFLLVSLREDRPVRSAIVPFLAPAGPPSESPGNPVDRSAVPHVTSLTDEGTHDAAQVDA